MRSHYSATCRGSAFPIGWNTSSATSVIVGLATDTPTDQPQARRPGSNALVTTAMH